MRDAKKIGLSVLNALDGFFIRNLARLGALTLVGMTILHGATRSGAFEDENSPWFSLPGRVASVVGLAADDIQISGLSQHDASEVLSVLAIRPGKPMLGFDANVARKTLATLPWLESASVAREYPNVLKISIRERVAVAIWQHSGATDLIDASGVTMGQPGLVATRQLPLVTGEGANLSVADFINLMSAFPELTKKVSAAARVGMRRWTLYLDNGVKVALPEQGAPEALKTAWGLDQSQGLFEKGISMIDMRVPGQMTVQVAVADASGSPLPASGVKQ
ncbi:cell division protein FtsQ/DivIB [Aestuariivirga litoralis]|uniref:cell division protein FtsQ/DivIB n=1 Tax=Aestuariivirga litoralis TaxID=2650924 RepID=UPI0018C58FE4|nr:cell division protein FtsQ/DivIB [Aestuariivirga litoralis]MBG1231951.1 FtsQ-type POTRA domain-containing protein [Aestuariivirga litoralis]